MKSSGQRESFTGRARRRTSPLVRWVDRIARFVIAAGGIGTIIMVALVCVFLVWVVVPLFGPARIDQAAAFPTDWAKQPPLKLGIDEYKLLGWALFPDGKLHTFRLADGHEIGPVQEIKGSGSGPAARMTASSFGVDGEQCAFGFADGSVRMGKIGFKSTYLKPTPDLPEALKSLAVGQSAEYGSGIVVKTPAGQFHLRKAQLELDPPTPPVADSPIVQISFAIRTEGPIFCTRSADGSVNVNSVKKQTNMVTDEETLTVDKQELPSLKGEAGTPAYLLISGLGDNVIVAWGDGRLLRFDIRDLTHPRLAERKNILEEDGQKLTALQYLIGGGTLAAGDSSGRVRAWSGAKPPNANTPDGIVLVAAHEFPAAGAPVTALASSSRDRALAAGTADGKVRLLYVTSDRVLAETQLAPAASVQALAMAPRGDALMAAGGEGLTVWETRAGYPEVTLATLFRPVWYEGYGAPSYSWQSSSGSDSFEPKFGLLPLIFGTLKATLYSMLFGAPLALLAALYTSEFLHPRWRATIKPTVEMMASLPSVVLGFLAGLVIAPVAETVVPAILASFFMVPFVLLLSAYLWQLVPRGRAVWLDPWRFLAAFFAVGIGVALAALLGPSLERGLFAGDLKAWLNHQSGSATPGWFVILLPLSAVAVAMLISRQLGPVLRRISGNWSRALSSLVELVKFIAGCVLTLALAGLVAFTLNGMGFDPRGWVVDTYVQRNSLIVGFMMGFAIIPLIYTIADDALSSVPMHLRSASLGAGATPWQTAVRIVIPTAMSGLFSALMIGLGRAVGETMIVLMAAGNTPIMQWNIFNGFQTLSATIATELPEAVRDSTHYRTLFLAALVLFIMTFVVNTLAEMVRLRFRRRAHEL